MNVLRSNLELSKTSLHDEPFYDACLGLIAAVHESVPFVRRIDVIEGPRWLGDWRTLTMVLHVGWWRSWLYREDVIMLVHRICHEWQPKATRIRIEVQS